LPSRRLTQDATAEVVAEGVPEVVPGEFSAVEEAVLDVRWDPGMMFFRPVGEGRGRWGMDQG